MNKYLICKNKTTDKYLCTILTTLNYRDRVDGKIEYFYDVEDIKNARQFFLNDNFDKYENYIILDYHSELRKQKLKKLKTL